MQLQQQSQHVAPFVQNGNSNQVRPVQASQQLEEHRQAAVQIQPQVQVQQPPPNDEEQREEDKHESEDASPDFRHVQHPTPAASPAIQQPIQHLQLPQQQMQQPPSAYPAMMNMNSHQMTNGSNHSANTSMAMGNAMSMFAAHAQQQSGSGFVAMPSPAADPRYGAFMSTGHHGGAMGAGMGMGMSMVGQIDHQQRFLAGMRSPHLQLHPGHQMHHQP